METIYVAQSECGLLKVGRTKTPDTRIKNLRVEFLKRGGALSMFFACQPTTNGRMAEKMLIEAVGERLKARSGCEWFYGGSFENAKRAAVEISDYVRETLPELRRLTPSERASLMRRTRKFCPDSKGVRI